MRKPLSYALKVYVEVYIETEVTGFEHFSIDPYVQLFDASRDRSGFGTSNSCYPLCSITFSTLDKQ